jgi:drug/metabolite transporter (DMT)-like permease
VQPGVRAEIGAILALMSGLCGGGYLVVTRMATDVGSPVAIFRFQAAFGAMALTPVAVLTWSWPTATGFALILAMGSLSAFSHILLIHAFRLAEASRLAQFVYLELVSASALGLVVFREFPDAVAWTGIAAVVASGFLTGLSPLFGRPHSATLIAQRPQWGSLARRRSRLLRDPRRSAGCGRARGVLAGERAWAVVVAA